MASPRPRSLYPSWAGLALGPLAWAIAHQTNYALADWQCVHGSRSASIVAAIAIVVSLAGAFLSYRAWSTPGAVVVNDAERPRRFLAIVGTMAALIFALVLALQFVATFIFSGCEH
jgi:hypothetical protein